MKLIYYAGLFLAGALLTQCSLDEPFLPSWDTRVKVNFRSQEFILSDVLSDSTLHDSLNAQLGDTLLYYTLEDSLEPQTVDATNLSISSKNDRIVKQVGTIHIDAPSPASTPEQSLVDLFPGLTIAVGAVLPPIPDQILQAGEQKVSFDNYLSVDVDSAKAHLVFYNNLIFDIRPGMQISLYDSSKYNDPDSGKIGTLFFNDSIPSGGSLRSNDLDLAGKTLSRAFYVHYKIPIKGTTSSRILTQDDVNSSFYIDVFLSDIQVSRAVAEIPEQRVEESLSSTIDTEGKSIRRAHISNGDVLLTIGNHLNVAAGLEITILNLRDAQDNPYVVLLEINANQSSSVKADLSGFTLKNHLTDGAPVEELAYNVVALTKKSNGYAEIQSTDSIEVDVSSSDISVDYFEGDVGMVDLSLDPVNKDGLLSDLNTDANFRMPDVVFSMTFYSEINFDISLNLSITGYHENSTSGQISDSVHIDISRTLARGASNQPGVTKIVLDGKGLSPNIVDLMAILPTSIKIRGSGKVSGDGSIDIKDALWMNYTVESPLSIQIDTPIEINSDVSQLTTADIDSATQDRITNDVSTVTLQLNSSNGLPLESEVVFSISSDSTLLFSEGEKVITEKLTLNAGTQGTNGLVVSPADNSTKLELTQQQLQLFNTLPLYYKTRATLKDSPNKLIFRSRDKLTVNGSIDINFQVDPNGF